MPYKCKEKANALSFGETVVWEGFMEEEAFTVGLKGCEGLLIVRT